VAVLDQVAKSLVATILLATVVSNYNERFVIRRDLVANTVFFTTEWPDSGAKTPDPDPADQQGHGTHVSGIIAGKAGA
jgi:hypothetical protein